MPHAKSRTLTAVAALALSAGLIAARAGVSAGNPAPAFRPQHDYRYPYGSSAFKKLVEDSYSLSGKRPMSFDAWLNTAYAKYPKAHLKGSEKLGLAAAMSKRAAQLAAAKDKAALAKLQQDTAEWTWSIIKATIRHFSLDRGYEFTSAATSGERQCLLQTVIIASLLQKMGVDAGMAMVWANIQGQESNLGHVVPIVRLADGHDVEIDASEPKPVTLHQGLLLLDPKADTYRFVRPVFTPAGLISAYRAADGGRSYATRDLQPVGYDYTRSQFYYYRGERVPGGFLGKPATRAGLRASQSFLQRSQALDPGNALAVYVLGLVENRLGETGQAKAQFQRAKALYQQYGHTPAGPKAAFKTNGNG